GGAPALARVEAVTRSNTGNGVAGPGEATPGPAESLAEGGGVSGTPNPSAGNPAPAALGRDRHAGRHPHRGDPAGLHDPDGPETHRPQDQQVPSRRHRARPAPHLNHPGLRSGGGPIGRTGGDVAHRAQRPGMTSRTRRAVSLGVRPTRTPTFSRASFFACAVPDDPDTIAPAWPIVFPSGAVNPATSAPAGLLSL